MKISHMFNVKLVTSLQKKIQQVLSHGSQLGGKNHLWFLSMTSLIGQSEDHQNVLEKTRQGGFRRI